MNCEGGLAIGVGYLFHEGTIHFSPSPSFAILPPLLYNGHFVGTALLVISRTDCIKFNNAAVASVFQIPAEARRSNATPRLTQDFAVLESGNKLIASHAEPEFH
jgi:hypothetical protein